MKTTIILKTADILGWVQMNVHLWLLWDAPSVSWSWLKKWRPVPLLDTRTRSSSGSCSTPMKWSTGDVFYISSYHIWFNCTQSPLIGLNELKILLKWVIFRQRCEVTQGYGSREASDHHGRELHRKVGTSFRGCGYKTAERVLRGFICHHVSGFGGDGQQQSSGAQAKRVSLGTGGSHRPGGSLDGRLQLHTVHILFLWLHSPDHSWKVRQWKPTGKEMTCQSVFMGPDDRSVVSNYKALFFWSQYETKSNIKYYLNQRHNTSDSIL